MPEPAPCHPAVVAALATSVLIVSCSTPVDEGSPVPDTIEAVSSSDGPLLPAGGDHLMLEFSGVIGVTDLREGRYRAEARVRSQHLDLSGDADHLAIWEAYKRQPVGAVFVDDVQTVRISTVGTGLLVDAMQRILLYRAETTIPQKTLAAAVTTGEAVPFASSVVYEFEVDPASFAVQRRCLLAVGHDKTAGWVRTSGTTSAPVSDGDQLQLSLSVPLDSEPTLLDKITDGHPCTCWDLAGDERPCAARTETLSMPDDPDPCVGIDPARCDGSPAYCRELLPFLPVRGPGWSNVPIADETPDDLYRSYLRRDLQQLVRHAAQTVACRSRDWPDSNGAPLALADMSEADGSRPGTSRGRPTHPEGSHADGDDIDVGYYQTAFFPDNEVRAVCPHLIDGVEAWRCVGPPDRLDVRRTALFVALLEEQPMVRCIGVDGSIAPLLREAQRELLREGMISMEQFEADKLCYETEDRGLGWFRSHHDHLHISAL